QIIFNCILCADQNLAHYFLEVTAHYTPLAFGISVDGKSTWRADRRVDVEERNALWASSQIIAPGFTHGGRDQLRLGEFDKNSLNENGVRVHAACQNFRRKGCLVICDCCQYMNSNRKLSIHGRHNRYYDSILFKSQASW